MAGHTSGLQVWAAKLPLYSMKRLLYRWVALVVSIIVASVVTDQIRRNGFELLVGTVADVLGLFVGAAALAIVNATLGNLLKILTVPLNCLTLGLFSLVINAAMLYLVGQFRFGFAVNDFLSALMGSVLIAIVSALLGTLIPDDEKEKD
jgi:putative membrane protein